MKNNIIFIFFVDICIPVDVVHALVPVPLDAVVLAHVKIVVVPAVVIVVATVAKDVTKICLYFQCQQSLQISSDNPKKKNKFIFTKIKFPPVF